MGTPLLLSALLFAALPLHDGSHDGAHDGKHDGAHPDGGSAQGAAQAPPAAPTGPIRMGEGAHRYEWASTWGDYRSQGPIGNTHGGIVFDSKGNLYFNTDSERAVMVLDKNGKLIKSWGKDLRGGLHGMTIVKDGDRESIFLAHTTRHEVAKATLDGDVLWRAGTPMESGVYQKADEFNPTAVAVAPNGDIFVGDGYGKSYVHQLNKDGKWIRTFGGPGEEPGKMRTPHGVTVVTRGGKSTLFVADRENHRLQEFDLDGKFLQVIAPGLRRPCSVTQRGDELVVADLEGRVTILDKDNKIVCHLGDNPDPAKRANNGVPMDQWQDGYFTSPHFARWDDEGNLYVLDWVSSGRLSKLTRLK